MEKHFSGSVAAPVSPRVETVLRPLGIHDSTISGGFWGERQTLNANAIIPHCLYWEEKVGWINNFSAQQRGALLTERQGREFSDSDVYKLLEAMAWEIGRTGDGNLQQQLDQLVELIGKSQGPDGYLNTKFDNPGQEPRYSDFEWGHELYNYGHLIQAAVARLRNGLTMDDPLVQIATRAADHVCVVFGPGGKDKVGGHPEIEVALAEFYRVTGEKKYLEQAQLFLDRRGHGTLDDIEFGRGYFQDDQPIRDAEVLRGHAVRALYLSAGAIDAAVERGDDELLTLVENQYLRTLAKRTYITGGMGSHHQDEAFGADYELPPDRAYCETCAGIASVMVAWRLLLARGDVRYADIIERTMYNLVAASPAEDGKAFFYTNTLHQRVNGKPMPTDKASPRATDSGRAAWFNVSCCPTNVARTFAQFSAYVATSNADGVQLLQFVPGTVTASLDDGRRASLQVSTDYPRDGRVKIEVVQAPQGPWTLTVRVPGWAQGARVSIAGVEHDAAAPAFVAEDLQAGDVVEVDLPMAPRWVYADERIDAVRGTVAVERGPLVLCAESVDQVDSADVSRLSVDAAQPLVDHGETVVAQGWIAAHDSDSSPYYSEPGSPKKEKADIAFVPYHSWANRGPSTMRIWVPVAQDV